MAKFGETLFDFKEVLMFFRIPVSCSEDKIFLNVGKNSIVKVYDGKPLHTWTLMHPHNFTSPVVHSEGNIYCVMDNNVLIRWQPDEDNLMNAEKVQFQEPIFVVIPMEGRLLILFNSGKYAIVHTATLSDFTHFDFILLKDNEELVWADAFKATKAVEVFCIVHNQKSQENTVYYFTVNKGDKTTSNLCIRNLSDKKATLKSWCLNPHESSLLSFWSDGTIFSHNVKEAHDSKLLSFEKTNVDSIVAIDTINSTHIAVATGYLKQKECILEIWDTKCAVLKAKKVLKTASLAYIQIAVMTSKIFLSYNEELVSVAFCIENPTFSAAIGKSLSKKKAMEYSWGTKTELFKVSTADEPEAMEVGDQDLINKSADSIKTIAQRLLNENADCVTHIQEDEIVKLLQLAIRYKNDETDQDDCLRKDTYAILNIVFSASFNDVFLVKYLKMLNSKEALVAIELLLSYLNTTVNLPSDITGKPSDLQIVNWAFLIIQSHVQDLLLSKDKSTQRLLKQFKRALSVKIEEFEDYESIQNYFSIIQKKNLLPQKCSAGKYCVESLDI